MPLSGITIRISWYNYNHLLLELFLWRAPHTERGAVIEIACDITSFVGIREIEKDERGFGCHMAGDLFPIVKTT